MLISLIIFRSVQANHLHPQIKIFKMTQGNTTKRMDEKEVTVLSILLQCKSRTRFESRSCLEGLGVDSRPRTKRAMVIDSAELYAVLD